MKQEQLITRSVEKIYFPNASLTAHVRQLLATWLDNSDTGVRTYGIALLRFHSVQDNEHAKRWGTDGAQPEN